MIFGCWKAPFEMERASEVDANASTSDARYAVIRCTSAAKTWLRTFNDSPNERSLSWPWYRYEHLRIRAHNTSTKHTGTFMSFLRLFILNCFSGILTEMCSGDPCRRARSAGTFGGLSLFKDCITFSALFRINWSTTWTLVQTMREVEGQHMWPVTKLFLIISTLELSNTA